MIFSTIKSDIVEVRKIQINRGVKTYYETWNWIAPHCNHTLGWKLH